MNHNPSSVQSPNRRSSRARSASVVVASFIGVLSLAPFTEAQHRIELPADATVESPRVELDLSNARVQVTIDPDEPSRLTAHVADPDTEGGAHLALDLSTPMVSRLSRPEAEGGTPRIVVELSLTPDQALAVTGDHLDLVVSRAEISMETTDPASSDVPNVGDPAGPRGSGEAGGAGVGKSTIVVTIADSDFSARNLEGLTLDATRGSNDIDHVAGPVELELYETRFHCRENSGQVTLHAVDSEVTFEDSEGAMSIDLNGGLLALNAGSTSVTGGISDADLQLVSISGMIRLTGAASSIWIINHSTSPIQLAGTDLRITIDNTGGRVNANLKGGRFDASGVGDRIDFQLSAGAEADVRDLASDIAGSITDGSRMVIDRVVGHTRIRLQDSELELSRLKSLELNAVGGFITGTEIRALIRVETDGSDLDLTLPTLGGRPTLVLKGSSTANVQIPTPCQVMAKVPAAPLREQVRVTGCQLDFDGARKGGIRRGLDGREPVRLSVAVEGDATVRVDGNP